MQNLPAYIFVAGATSLLTLNPTDLFPKREAATVRQVQLAA